MRLFDLRDPLIAVALLTRLPAPVDHALAGRRAAAAAWAWPLVGAAVGALAGGTLALAAALGLPPLASGALGVAAGLLATGGLHEDGLADAADGFGAWGSAERRLEIMRDSRVGAFGAAALALALLLKASLYGALAGEQTGVAVGLAAAAGAMSRAPLPLLLRLGPSARADGLASATGRPGAAAVATALGLGALAAAGAGLAQGAAASLLALGAALMLLRTARRKIGGVTGDVLGAAQVAAEIGALAALAAR